MSQLGSLRDRRMSHTQELQSPCENVTDNVTENVTDGTDNGTGNGMCKITTFQTPCAHEIEQKKITM